MTQTTCVQTLAHSQPAPVGRPPAATCPEGLSPGLTLGGFELLSPIDRGEMGTVYAARQKSLDRTVAVKVLHPHLRDDARTVRRFEREAVAAARLTHPAFARVHCSGVADGCHFLAMEYVDGRPLDEWIAAASRGSHAPWIGPGAAELDPGHCRAATQVVSTLADALHHAHRRGVVHCDVKPRNILLSPGGRPHLVDFGLARIDGDNSEFARMIAGTLHYMSPEQLMGGTIPVDHRCDVFALGVVLYEILTLQRPFDGATGQDLVEDVMFLEPLPARQLNPSVSPALQHVCHRAIAKYPGARFRTMAEFADALRACPRGGEA